MGGPSGRELTSSLPSSPPLTLRGGGVGGESYKVTPRNKGTPQRAPLHGLVLNRPLPGLGYPSNQQCPPKPPAQTPLPLTL